MSWKRLLLCVGLAACGDDDATQGDGPLTKTSFTLCDGSDGVRLSLVSGGGGPLPEDDLFSHPYGSRFLHVDGHCNFVTNGEAKGKLVTGTFSAEQAATIQDTLGLERTRGVIYRPQGGCPDAPSNIVQTPDAVLEWVCGATPPAQIADAFHWDPVFALAKSAGTPLHGAISMVARPYDVVLNSAILWPFSWPITDIDAQDANYHDVPKHAKTVAGAEAETARTLWDGFLASKVIHDGLPMISSGLTYNVFFRDELDAAFAAKLTKPESAFFIPRCEASRLLRERPQNANLYEHSVVATLPEDAPCGSELCWEGNFDESSPVQTSLGLQKPRAPRTCLGPPYLSVSADLQPLIDAFRAGYPSSPVEVNLGFATLRDR